MLHTGNFTHKDGEITTNSTIDANSVIIQNYSELRKNVTIGNNIVNGSNQVDTNYMLSVFGGNVGVNENLIVEGDISGGNNISCQGDITCANATVKNNMDVSGVIDVSSVIIQNYGEFHKNVTIGNNIVGGKNKVDPNYMLSVFGGNNISAVGINGDIDITGDIKHVGKLDVSGGFSLNGNITHNGNNTHNGHLGVTGGITLNGKVVHSGDFNHSSGLFSCSNLTVSNTLTTNIISPYNANGLLAFGTTDALYAYDFNYSKPPNQFQGLHIHNRHGDPGCITAIGFNTYTGRDASTEPPTQIRATDNGAFSQDLSFWTTPSSDGPNASKAVERMCIDQKGNVGIGTSSPSAKLHIHQEYANSGSYPAGEIKFSTNNSTTTWQMASIGTYVAANNGGTSGYPGGLVFKTKAPDNDHSSLPVERMVIDSNGNVGIGTPTPNATLDVSGDIILNGKVVHAGDFNHSGGTMSCSNLTVSNTLDVSGGCNVDGKLKNSWIFSPSKTSPLYIENTSYGEIYITGNTMFLGGGAGNSNNAIFTNKISEAGGPYPWGGFYIIQGQQVGTTWFVNSQYGDGPYPAFQFANQLHNILTIYGDGTVRANGVQLTSDRRLKKNIVPTQYGLESILSLKPVSYIFKNDNDTTHIGFIAQDVENVLPELVNKSDPEKLSLDYNGIIPVLTNAVKELNTKHENELASVKDELASVKDELSSVKDELNELRDFKKEILARLQQLESNK